jgi:hypothetical protein
MSETCPSTVDYEREGGFLCNCLCTTFALLEKHGLLNEVTNENFVKWWLDHKKRDAQRTAQAQQEIDLAKKRRYEYYLELRKEYEGK